MASKNVRVLAKIEARELADILGISEDAPLAYLSKPRLSEGLDVVNKLSETARAAFCSVYLPILVKSLRTVATASRNPFALTATAVLVALRKQRLFRGHFLRTSLEAVDLLHIIVQVFIAIPRDIKELDPQHKIILTVLRNTCTLIHSIIESSLTHGSMRQVDLVLPPSLASTFLSTCRSHLATPFMVTLDPKTATPQTRGLKRLLEVLPMCLGIEGAGELVGTRIVRENATSEGMLRCRFAKEKRDADGLIDSPDCGKVSGKKRKPKLCGKCKSVAYCSPEHQQADWKQHKQVCFAPSW